MNIIGRIIASLVTYYETRGKDELKSILATVLTVFPALMVEFCIDCGSLVFDPSVALKDAGITILVATARSLVVAFLFALLPKSFPIRTSKK